LNSIPLERPAPTAARPQRLCLDRDFDSSPLRELAVRHGYAPHIRARVEEAAHSWLNRNRALIALKKAHAARLAAALQG
jgi:hypothetical protein